jgi:hypothetical protein
MMRRIAATEALFGKGGAAFARFTMIRFSRVHHSDGLNNVCNTISEELSSDQF